MYHSDLPSRSEVRETAAERTDSLDQLIRPSDVTDGANSWTELDRDTVKREIHYGLTEVNYHTQQKYKGLIIDLAERLLRESLTRAPMSDLSFETEKEALRNGYWPNSMHKHDMFDVAYNELMCHEFSNDDISRIYRECENEAREVVEAGIVDGQMPDMFEE